MQAVGQKNSILKLVIAEFPLCVRRSAQTSSQSQSYRCVRTFFSFFSAIAITHHQRKLQGNATAMREGGLPDKWAFGFVWPRHKPGHGL